MTLITTSKLWQLFDPLSDLIQDITKEAYVFLKIYKDESS